MKTACTLVVGCLLLAGGAQASGFRLNGHSARAEGMGVAVTALTDEASSIYYNPAGISGHAGIDVSVGINLIVPSVTFASDVSVVSTTNVTRAATPFNAYLAVGLTDEVAVGFGVYTPFGAGNTWPAGWEGAGRALTSNVQTFDFNPVVSWRIHPRVKVAAGLQFVRGTVAIERGLNFVDSQGTVSLGGDAWGVGWNGGFQVELVEKSLWLGASWRSAVTMGFKGSAHFSNIPPAFQGLLVDQGIRSTITLPDVATVGLGYRATEALRFGLDLNVVTWSSFTDLTIAFDNPALTNPLPKQWRDTVSYHAGVEYDLLEPAQVRLGFVYDPTGTPTATLTPDLPDFSRFVVTVGGGWRSDFGLSVDVAYQFIALFTQRSAAPGFAGLYSGAAHVVGLNVGFKL